METTATDATVAPGTVVAGYNVAERIGVGGFGEVYRARHSVLGRDVAIKVLHRRYSHDPAAIARFVAEARAASKISHPGIVEVFDFGTLGDGRQFFVMELVSGTTLREVLRDRERLSVDDALPMLSGIAEAIDAAHRAGIAHRDLKPDNIFVLADGSVKVIDFGLAKLVDATDAPVTETGSVLGTPLYMSPEQCRGSGSDTRSDTYSFGVIAYQMLTGEPPFAGDALALALHHLNDDPDPPSQRHAELPMRVDRALLAALAKDPAERPSTLIAIVEALAGGALLPAVTRSGRRRRHMRTMLLAGVVALGVATFAVAMTAKTRKPEAFEEPCGAAVLRLTGVWDAPRRTAVEARFAKIQRPEVAGTWHAASGELDAYAKQWATQWNQACREMDPINLDGLRPKRISCLNDALANLQGVAELLATADITTLARGWTASFVETELDDCVRRNVLRASQLDTPIANRSRSAELIPEVYRANGAARLATNAGQPVPPETLTTLDQLASRLDALHSYAATTALGDLAGSEIANGTAPAARQTIDRVIARAETTKDDLSIGYAYGRLGWLAVDLDVAFPGSGFLDEAETALARGDLALAAVHSARFNVVARARMLSLRGKPDMALQALDGSLTKPHDPLDFTIRVELLSRNGRDREAIIQAQQIVAFEIGRFGEIHLRTALAHFFLAKAFALSGDVDRAIVELERALDIGKRVDMPASMFPQMRTLQLSLAGRTGRADLTARAVTALLRGEGAPIGPISAQDWIAIARLGFVTGGVEAARNAVAQLPRSRLQAEAFAFLDLGIGDFEMMRQRAMTSVRAKPRNDPALVFVYDFSPWLVALADASAGRTHEAEDRLARLAPAHATSNENAQLAYMFDGIVFVALHRWSEAQDSFERARGILRWAANHAGLATVDAFDGFARVESGDPSSAIAPLERSLGIFAACCDGFHFAVPLAEFALARALWEAGDRPHARIYAQQARDHYARLGPFKSNDRAAAVKWLADHELPACSVGHLPTLVYLNRDGGAYAPGPINSSANTTTLLHSPATFTNPALDDATWGKLFECLQHNFAPFDIRFVDTDPGASTHKEIVFATPSEYRLAMGTNADTYSTTSEISPRAGEPKTIVITSALSTSANNRAYETECTDISQAIGESFGLSFEQDACDVMSYSGCARKSFVDADRPCIAPGITANVGDCNGGGTVQNSYRRILELAGPACIDAH